MKKNFLTCIAVILVFALSAAALCVVNTATKAGADAKRAQANLKELQAIFPAAVRVEEDAETGILTAYDAQDQIAGYLAKATASGYDSVIEAQVACDPEGVVLGVAIGGTDFAESQGLGSKVQESAFAVQFNGGVAPFAFGNEEGDIEAITSATITSNAALRGINDATAQIAAFAGFADDAAAGYETLENGHRAVTVQGFGGPVYVEVALDDNGSISEIVIGDDQFAETPGLGGRAQEDEFKAQFIGKSGAVALGTDVEAISGATITSTAVTDAVNILLGSGAAAAPYETLENGHRAVTVQGFGGPVYVEFALDDNGAISEIVIGDDQFAETPGLGGRAQEDEFKAQFIGKSGAVALGTDVEAISGATVTSTAVADAVNTLLSGGAAAPAAPAVEEAPAAAPAPMVVPEGAVEASATAQGLLSPVFVKIAVADNAIAAIEIGDDQFAETPGLGAKALEDGFKAQFIGKALPMTIGDIDAIAGATVTSQAVVDAVNAAYATIGGAEAAPAEEAAPVEEAVPVEEAAPVEESAPAEEAAPEAPAEEAEVTAASAGAAEASASVQGLLGPVFVKIGVDGDKITSIEIGDDQFAETPGLGAKALEDEFMAQFIGMALPMVIDDIEAITGATVTSQAVVDAINAAYATVAAEEAPAALAANEATGEAQGLIGPVFVKIAVDGDKIASIEIGDDRFAESRGLGAKALEDAFKAQFIGKALPMAIGDIDAIAGATITTQAVVDAVNAAYATLGAAAAPAEEAPAAAEEAPVEEAPAAAEAAPAEEAPAAAEEAPAAAEAAPAAAKEASATAQGLLSPVFVKITVEGDKITAIEIGDDQFAETPGLGAKALEDEFKAQFIGKALPMTIGDIDAIAGATVTSQAVVDAVNAAYATLGAAETAPAAAKEASATAQGLLSPVFVKITVEGDKITAIQIGDDQFAETPGLGAKALEDEFMAQFIDMALPMALEDIEAIAGATVTSQAVIDAINAAYAGIQ